MINYKRCKLEVTMPSIVKNLTEALNNDELDLAFDKARAFIDKNVPEDKRQEVLQTLMTTLKDHPDQEDAFVANPTAFGPLATYNQPSAEEGSIPSSETNGIQIKYDGGKKTLTIAKYEDSDIIVSAEGSKSLADAIGEKVSIDRKSLKIGAEFSMMVEGKGNWNSHSAITEINPVNVTEDEFKAVFTPNVNDPEELDNKQKTELDNLSVEYPVIVKCIQQRFRNNPEDGEKVAAMLNKILNGAGQSKEKWLNYITVSAKKGTDRAVIQNKIIPTIANACGVDVPRQVNDDQRDTLKDRNGKQVGTIVIPEGFNQAPIELGDQVMSMDFGYPTINFNSELIRQILHTDPASNPKQLKKLLKALMERVNGSPAGQALIKEFIFSFSLTKTTGGVKRSAIYKLIKNAATAEGIPMLRRPLKVDSEELVGKSEAKTVKVVPLNAIAKEEPATAKDKPATAKDKPATAKEEPATESIDWLEYDPLFEGWFSEKVLGRNKSEDTQKTFGNEIELPSLYLKQFYTILVPSGPTGLHNYARYMTAENRASIAKRLGDETIEEIKTSNHNVNDMVLQKFVEANDGVPPFYILKPRTKPTKERLRVCDETNVNGKVCIKSIDGKNKAAYFMDKDKIDSVFEAG